jgi:sigma-B regulation protein RsbU (phosphoserine phosphatase)
MSVSCAEEARILIADDQRDLLDALRLLLKSERIHMEAVTTPDAAVAALQQHPYDLLLMDLNYTVDTTSGAEGMDLLSRVQSLDRSLPVIVMTGWGSVDLAVETMRRGVRDFVQKPWDNAELVAMLRKEIEGGRERRRRADSERREFEEARRIQRKLLPNVLPAVEGCEIAAHWQPAAGVGGDFYDAIAFGSHRVGLAIADVVGKGIPAALLMSNLQATVRAFATEAARPAELVTLVNHILCGHIAEGRFISFFYCLVDTALGTLAYCNAGHYAPMLVRADGTSERLIEGGAVLGVFPDATYAEGQAVITAGDRIVLFTDGVSEARNAADDEYGEDRLLASTVASRACSAPALESRLAADVATFTGGAFHDDATLIVVAIE